jgi:hypothetical protein
LGGWNRGFDNYTEESLGRRKFNTDIMELEPHTLTLNEGKPYIKTSRNIK